MAASTAMPSGHLRALVLGGGGSLGRAFHWGLAAGFLDAGIDLREADLIIGTSAGSMTGARLALGADPRQGLPFIDPPSSASPAGVASAFQQLTAACARALTSPNPEDEWRAVGQMALTARTPSESASLARESMASLVGHPWPANYRATAVDANTGRFQLWGPDSGVPLQRGVASSGALPGVWPPVTIGESRYVDGGVRSMLNADLAAGSARVLVISCFDLSSPPDAPEPTRLMNDALRAEIDRLGQSGLDVEVITPGNAFLKLSGYGAKMLDGSLVPEAYALSREQAQNESTRIRRLWNTQGLTLLG